ncbi:ABC transporter ATP-binding protein [Allohahella marinimesophila]|uniref:ABC transporter ATP-binding protein n=1 Tax=Allohahella marinimesophila TaxID=1054972 RepID=A0ABP7NGT7_9GAMM
MSSTPVISINGLTKTYQSGHHALSAIDLEIQQGEIFALLGPNGAGKTTLISIICGIVTRSAGSVAVAGYDIERDYRVTRAMIGLVPQELTTDAFESVWDTVSLSRGMFGHPPNRQHIEKILRQLSLWDKRKNQIMTLSGGMKRRVMIAKALSHEPRILFLDEPTAGVDVNLRRDMWQIVKDLRDDGVTIILTTHYIEEAEEMADRIGVIRSGELILVEDKVALMSQLGRKQLIIQLDQVLTQVPAELAAWSLTLNEAGTELHYGFGASPGQAAGTDGIGVLLKQLESLGIVYTDLTTRQRSLEEIFVNLVEAEA